MAGLLDFVLPAIFSAGDSAKRQIKGLLGDPVGTVKQFINNKNDQAAAHLADVNLSTQGMMAGLLGGQATPEQLAADQRWTQALANGYNPAGMIVWHGSPHNFTKFDASKIGTGEGAQAYGHGMYLAESPAVANSYAKELGELEILHNGKPVGIFDKDPAANAAHQIRATGGDLTKAVQRAQNLYTGQWRDSVVNEIQRLGKGDVTERLGGNVYKVDLPDEHIAKMLDWDKPLSQQAPEVQKALQEEAKKYAARGAKIPNAGMMYKAMEYVADETGKFGGKRGLTEYLRSHGIPGIRYLDGGSRGAGQGTSNFVVFAGNEDILKILERNGVPLK